MGWLSVCGSGGEGEGGVVGREGGTDGETDDPKSRVVGGEGHAQWFGDKRTFVGRLKAKIRRSF